MRLVALIILLVVATLDANGQLRSKFYNYNAERGLRSNIVYSMHKARNGLLYIAHEKGLSSFDGRNFINYSFSKFANSELASIAETDNGTLFCQKFNNDVYYLSEKGTLEQYGYFPSATGFNATACHGNSFYAMRNDTLVIADIVSGKRTQIPLRPTNGIPEGEIVYAAKYTTAEGQHTVCVDKQNRVYVHGPADLKETFTWHVANGQVYGVPPDAEAGRVFHLNSRRTISVSGLNGAAINNILQTERYLWICTTNGLFRRKTEDTTAPFLQMMTGMCVTCVSELNENSIIAGTIGNGLIYVPNFNVMQYEALPGRLSSFTIDRKNLFAGSRDGSITTIQLSDGRVVAKEEYSNAPIDFLLYTHNARFVESNAHLNKCEHKMSVRDHCDIDGGTLLATSDGIYLHKTAAGKHWIDNYATGKQSCGLRKLNISNEYTGTIIYDNVNRKVYLNNYSGIFELDSGMTGLKPVPEPYCALRDLVAFNGKLHLATKDKGILVLEDGVYQRLPGLDDIFYRMQVYGNELWIQGESGIYCLQGGSVSKYEHNIGLSPSDITSFAVDSTNVYIIEAGNIVRFNKRILVSPSAPTRFILHGATCGNTRFSSGSRLPPDQNNIKIRYSLVSLGNNANAYAAYSVNGGDKVLLPANMNTLELNYLKPDKYRLQFYLSENGRLRQGATFEFTIVPHFYNTTWFYILVLSAATLSLFVYNKRRIAAISTDFALRQSKLQLEHALDKSMLTSIKAQMNPHFLYNALNTIQSYVYMNDRKNAGLYISKFSDLTRKILDHSSKDLVTLAEELEALTLYLELENMRFDNGIQYTITTDPNINTNTALIPPLLLQPYVENAIKHGLFHKRENRKLQIRFTKTQAGIMVEIEDNGIGRKRREEVHRTRPREHQPFSMSANKKRLEILKQYQPNIHFELIDLHSPLGEPTGTLVRITLPEKWAWNV